MDTSNKAEKHKKTLKHCVWAIKLRMKQKRSLPFSNESTEGLSNPSFLGTTCFEILRTSALLLTVSFEAFLALADEVCRKVATFGVFHTSSGQNGVLTLVDINAIVAVASVACKKRSPDCQI